MKKHFNKIFILVLATLILVVLSACEFLPALPTSQQECEHRGGTATCTESAICELCGEPYGDPLGHDIVIDSAVKATCTEDGREAGQHCSRCDGATVVGKVIEAGHDVDENGECTVCGYVIAEAADALIAALEAGKNVILMNDLTLETTLTGPYGNATGLIQKGGIFDGNGHTLSVSSDTKYAIVTYGGTIKNLTIDSGFRAIVTNEPTEDVIIDNVTIAGDDIVYALNTLANTTTEGVELIVKNSTLNGWTSFAGNFESATFENCTFGQGIKYTSFYGRLVKPYINTTFVNCSFIKNMYLDLCEMTEGQVVTFEDCKVDGNAVTADVFTTAVDSEEYPFTYENPTDVTVNITTLDDGSVQFSYPTATEEE